MNIRLIVCYIKSYDPATSLEIKKNFKFACGEFVRPAAKALLYPQHGRKERGGGVKEKREIKIITTHHQAYRDYFVLETYEAGIVLAGCEVKSLRESEVNLSGSFARFEKDVLYLYNLYIAPYVKGNRENEEPLRNRRLLLHRSQLLRLLAKTQEKGLALIPMKLYFNERGIAKVELAVARGKKLFDKRSDIKKMSIKRDIDRAIKNRNRK